MLKMNEKVAANWKEFEEQNTSLKTKLLEALTKVSHLEA